MECIKGTWPDHRLVQIAGVHDREEAELIAACGVDWLGIPLRLPVNKEDLSEEEARLIVRHTRLTAVLITYLKQPEVIIDLAEYLGVCHIQLHGPVPAETLSVLRMKRPRWFLMKSLIIGPGADEGKLLEEAKKRLTVVDAFLTDTHNPATGADGATGKTHDWSISRNLVRQLEKPIILAGGLTPKNLKTAITQVDPAGVDAHTGVEGPDGRKDEARLKQFVQAARHT